MSTPSTGILLLNIGSPNSPQIKDVKSYLAQFLNDPKVINLPWLLRSILVNGIIIPFRAPKSAKLYHQLWTSNGSPLLYYSTQVAKKLQERLGNDFFVLETMRYGNPSVATQIDRLKKAGIQRVILVPLFPQHATSTSESAIEECLKELSQTLPIHYQVVPAFYHHSAFITSIAAQIKEKLSSYHHILFSYHGLPLSHIKAIHPTHTCQGCSCEQSMPAHGAQCYKAQCYETSRLLANHLGLSTSDYSVSFQSRLTKKWLTPFTDETLIRLANTSHKKVMVISPSFVADCLETLIEIKEEYNNIFIHAGGETLTLVPGLNDSPEWIAALHDIITPYLDLSGKGGIGGIS